MGFFYPVLNIFFPVTLLSYKSLLKFSTSSQTPYGKWALMMITIYCFSWMNWIFTQSYPFYFIDLLFKVAIAFLPDKCNAFVEHKISNLHLEIWLDQLRCRALTIFYNYYWKITAFVISKMEANESDQFKEGILLKLSEKQTQNSQPFAFKPKKHYINVGVNCDKTITGALLNDLQTAKKFQEFSKKIVQGKHLHNETFGQIKITKQQVSDNTQSKEQSGNKTEPAKQTLPKFHYKNSENISKVVKKIQNIRESQQQLDLPDSQKLQQQKNILISPISKRNQKISQKNVVFSVNSNKMTEKNEKKQLYYRNSKIQTEEKSELRRTYTFNNILTSEGSSHLQKWHKSYRQDGDLVNDDLINKFDVSSSQYSGMFDESDDEDQITLEAKVEVLLEIGKVHNSRLEIYNLELYTNRQLKIISLYDREFQNHKLKAIKPLPSGYYELIFEDGPVKSRKCKFRGQYQAFMKYMQK